MEIDCPQQAKELHDQTSKLIEKIKTKQVLSDIERNELLSILSKASYEFFETSQEMDE